MTAEELETVHSAFWAGVTVAREGGNLVLAYRELIAELIEKRNYELEVGVDEGDYINSNYQTEEGSHE